jgi:hypothetical protein
MHIAVLELRKKRHTFKTAENISKNDVSNRPLSIVYLSDIQQEGGLTPGN